MFEKEKFLSLILLPQVKNRKTKQYITYIFNHLYFIFFNSFLSFFEERFSFFAYQLYCIILWQTHKKYSVSFMKKLRIWKMPKSSWFHKMQMIFYLKKFFLTFSALNMLKWIWNSFYIFMGSQTQELQRGIMSKKEVQQAKSERGVGDFYWLEC